MTLEELRRGRSRDPEPPWRADREKASVGPPGLWMSVRPGPGLPIDVQSAELATLLTDARKVGHRPTGWSYVSTLGYRQLNAASAFTEAPGYQRTAVFGDGRIELWCAFERLNHSNVPEAIYPFALIELPLSVLRLAKHVLELAQSSGEVLVDLAMFGAEGRTLLPGSPQGFSPNPPGKLDGDLLLPQPLRFTVDELRASPEKCNLRLITVVYQAFGLERDDLPAEIDRHHRVLTSRLSALGYTLAMTFVPSTDRPSRHQQSGDRLLDVLGHAIPVRMKPSARAVKFTSSPRSSVNDRRGRFFGGLVHPSDRSHLPEVSRKRIKPTARVQGMRDFSRLRRCTARVSPFTRTQHTFSITQRSGPRCRCDVRAFPHAAARDLTAAQRNRLRDRYAEPTRTRSGRRTW